MPDMDTLFRIIGPNVSRVVNVKHVFTLVPILNVKNPYFQYPTLKAVCYDGDFGIQ